MTMQNVWVTWGAKLFDNDQPITSTITTLTPPWGVLRANAADTARKLIEQWFTLALWNEWFGLDSGEGEIIVEIFEPDSIRGKYRVGVELEVKASFAETFKEKT